jgi:hypothetical protein
MVSNSNPSVLAEATCYYDRRVFFEETICFPIFRSIVDPSLVAVDDKPIKVLEVFKVQPDGWSFPGSKDEYAL